VRNVDERGRRYVRCPALVHRRLRLAHGEELAQERHRARRWMSTGSDGRSSQAVAAPRVARPARIVDVRAPYGGVALEAHVQEPQVGRTPLRRVSRAPHGRARGHTPR
jgi:hypothetical protein